MAEVLQSGEAGEARSQWHDRVADLRVGRAERPFEVSAVEEVREHGWMNGLQSVAQSKLGRITIPETQQRACAGCLGVSS